MARRTLTTAEIRAYGELAAAARKLRHAQREAERRREAARLREAARAGGAALSLDPRREHGGGGGHQ
jgi:hypothetical protein